ncbi:sensor domain-containing diguanylate cyclase [Actinotalea sp. K2]|uniref:sensor domain-containing diguanylate cyclase n=1 Tax=Actinotalea sp. K2 TaxID=2939438 RepID=UPI002017EA48|nr:sensor domain-containing diguanylate cyclase [Actinotalea sp. K2]MCL3861621.1 sensor domain-containing diguanylate cyclase [Actinotalea sp. K2]
MIENSRGGSRPDRDDRDVEPRHVERRHVERRHVDRPSEQRRRRPRRSRQPDPLLADVAPPDRPPRHYLRTGLATVLSVVALYPFFTWLESQGLVQGPVPVLTLLLPLAALLTSEDIQRRVGGGRVDNRPVLRFVLSFVTFGTLVTVAGWGFTLPATAILIAVVHVERSGPRTWRPAVAVTVAGTVLVQVATQLGWVPSVLPSAASHVGAVWILLLAVTGIAAIGRSVGERDAAAHALARTEARLRALMDSSTDVLTVSDAQGVLTYVSPAVGRAMGHSADSMLGRRLLDLVDPEQRAEVENELRELVSVGSGAQVSLDVLVVHASLERRWYEWTVHNLLADPLVQGVVVDQRDITERLLAQDGLAHAAAHDDLTGLPNRGELLRRLTGSLPQAGPGAAIAMLFIDLDHFKAINDTLGHQAGDELLVAVARRLRSALRTHDHLARLGGDEFGALLTEIRDEGEVRGIVERLVRAVEEPVPLAAGPARVGASIGFSLTTDPAADADRLFGAADASMYLVKNARRRSGASAPGTGADQADR